MNKFLKLMAVFVSCSTITTVSFASDKVYTFSVVPQQSASKTAAIWKPILKYLSDKTGQKFKLSTAKNIPTFEKRLEEEKADFSYMNPYHYTVYHERSGYNAIARAKDKRIKGVVVVQKDSPLQKLEELDGHTLAFPSPAAFAASLLPRGFMKANGINITPKYVSSHDSVYLNVVKGRMVAGGGIVRTFKNTKQHVRDNLRVLWTTDGYTPHAIAAHKRVDGELVKAVQQALVDLGSTEQGLAMVGKMKLKGFIAAQDADWNDVRSLKLNEL
ncbi:Periplasmic binding protein-related protein [Candidatus Terasakiella magnetica]|uniref:Periplasmic binding protein-related protein n=1 Tax=Candidatus Terasakiella magnetica TaxID=1867952 RepID=A0A1C3RDL3_9PROT|nr:phosphate/phosphite/phosphonate ABC transporter substrate-binding protein [Candidatus Terasakiella magnetica]SCA55332.1 Periplasmic binding protein-related protein [Candidatus Terasakiella magnetica]